MGKDAEAEKDFAHYLEYAGDAKFDVRRLAQQALGSRLAKK